MDSGGDLRLGLVLFAFGSVLLWAGLGGFRLWRSGDPQYGRFKRDTSIGRILAALIVFVFAVAETLAAIF